MNDRILRAKRASEVMLREHADIVVRLALDKAAELGLEKWLRDYDSMFLAGYAYELRSRIYRLPREPMQVRGLAHARGRLAALRDLERMGVA
ncbi:MAG: hypothetical protein HPY73_05780 [Methanomassiliicoccales archaeon]|nr:MAG: hypothetical protein HPY73_05780 [Methanomassiliicoccales archaeon]